MEIIEKLFAPSITDWIQAIASCVAVLGAIAAFYSLFKKDKQKQEQITKLTDLVSKIDTQNEILMEQLKISIIPFFKITDDYQIDGMHGCLMNLKNFGDVAVDVDITIVNDKINPILTFDKINKSSYIDKLDLLLISIKRIADYSIPFLNIPICFQVNFKDRLKNEYYQIVHGTGYSFNITVPEKIETPKL